MPIFTVEGVVGAGKTSFLDRIKTAKFDSEHIIVFEPVEEWMNIKLDGPDEPSIFEKFYADKQKHGFMFQMLALQTRVSKLIDVSREYPDAIIICERSHLSDSKIFAKMLRDMEILSKEEYYVYKAWYDMCEKYFFSKFAGVIYLNTSPSVCVERIMQRARSGEDRISFDYIKKLHQLHEEFVQNTDLKVCMVDGNLDASNPNYQAEVIDNVVSFCNSFL